MGDLVVLETYRDSIIEQKALRAVARSQYNCSVDLRQLADELDAVIWQRHDDDPNFLGEVFRNNECDPKYRLSSGAVARYVVYVRRDLSDEVKNFTVAHELSHIIRHRDVLEKHGRMPRNWQHLNRFEREADELAAAILIPAKQLNWKIRSRGRPWEIWELSAVFGVSLSAMKRRLDCLGINSKDHNVVYTGGWQFRRFGPRDFMNIKRVQDAKSASQT